MRVTLPVSVFLLSVGSTSASAACETVKKNPNDQIACLISAVGVLEDDLAATQADLAASQADLAVAQLDLDAALESIAFIDIGLSNLAIDVRSLDALLASVQETADDLVAHLGSLSDYVTVDIVQHSIFFTGANVFVRSGSGATDGPVNGLGNLIIGYGEDATYYGIPFVSASERSGSHNLVVGGGATYTSYGGFVAGLVNSVSGAFASVSGGKINTASGDTSSVSGGDSNGAAGLSGSVSGGTFNDAVGTGSSVCGGEQNDANGGFSAILGGLGNVVNANFGTSP